MHGQRTAVQGGEFRWWALAISAMLVLLAAIRPALLVPVATALMFGAFLVLAQNSAVAPFIYSLF